MGRPGGDSTAPGMQIATHMSPQPEGLEGGEARKEHAGTEEEQKRWLNSGGKDLVKTERSCQIGMDKSGQRFSQP